jgi:uncharacterized protein YutD
MSNIDIKDILQNIKCYYQKIVELSETFKIDSTSEKYSIFLDKRGKLLEKVSLEQLQLESINENWREISKKNPELSEITNDINTLISMTLGIDDALKATLLKKMESIKNDMAQLGNYSKAAVAYTKRTRQSYK